MMRTVAVVFMLCTVLNAATLRVMHLSDLHYDDRYDVGSPAHCVLESTGLDCCHWYSIPIEPHEQAGPYGNFNCDSPLLLIESSLQWLNNTFETDPSSKPDLILWTGDSPSHHDFDQSPARNLGAITTLSNLLMQYFPDIPVYPALGNHDTWPIDQMELPTANSWLTDPVASLWGSKWITGAAEQATMRLGLFYSTQIAPGWRVVSINTLFYDVNNKMPTDADPAGQMLWLRQTFEAAETAGERVWVIGHIFPGNGEMANAFTLFYQELATNYSHIIAGHFWGHSHRDQFTFLRNATDPDTVVGVSYIAPSIMPDHVFPSARFYTYDPATYDITDFEMWNTNITVCNENNTPPVFEYFYSAKEFYNMTDLSIASWQALATQLAEPSWLFQEYMAHYQPGLYVPGACVGECQASQICSILWVAAEQLDACNNGSLPLR